MIKCLQRQSLKISAAFVVGFVLTAAPASAQTTIGGSGGKNFSDIAGNISNSIADLPGLISGISYLLGVLLAVLGIMKVKDHVENPTNTPMKDGAVRLASGGALFALPIVTEAMSNTIGATGYHVAPAELHRVELGIR